MAAFLTYPPLDVATSSTKEADAASALRWGILGCGPISADWVKALGLGLTPGAVVAAVAARDPSKAAAFAKAAGAERVHHTYAELVSDPGVDIVYVGTVTPLHKEHVLLAIAAGKHVLCEKPLALNAADGREMYAAAKAAGVALFEGMWTRFFPAVEHARKLLDGGQLGAVRTVHADFCDMCYAVQYVPLAFGAAAEPTAVAAAGGFSKATCGAVPSGAVVAYGGEGCAVLSFPAWKSEFPEVVEIVCVAGRITLDMWGSHPTRITVRRTPPACFDEPQGHHSTSQNGVLPDTEQHTYALPRPPGYEAGAATGWHYVNQSGFAFQAAAIHRCLAAGLLEAPQYTAADSLRTLQLLDAIEAACVPVAAPARHIAPCGAATAPNLEVVMIGCGVPKFSMGWTHAFQMMQPPLSTMAEVVGVVEPFFLSDAGTDARGSDAFRAWMAEQLRQTPGVEFAASCAHLRERLGAPTPGTVRVAVIAVRTAESEATFRAAVLELGCRAVYLEKPGATSVSELDGMIELAQQRGVTVMLGYTRNMGTYLARGLAHARQLAPRATNVTLLHSNPFQDDELDACFERCRPGILYDMACHDLAIAVACFGLSADGFTDLRVDLTASVQQKRVGIQDFVRLKFSLRPKAGAEPIGFMIDRQAGAFNGMEIDGRRFMCGEPPLLFPNPLSDLSPHLAVQYDYYVEAKRVLFESLAAAADQLAKSPTAVAPLPANTPTLEVAREVLLVADRLTQQLQEAVPLQPQPSDRSSSKRPCPLSSSAAVASSKQPKL